VPGEAGEAYEDRGTVRRGCQEFDVTDVARSAFVLSAVTIIEAGRITTPGTRTVHMHSPVSALPASSQRSAADRPTGPRCVIGGRCTATTVENHPVVWLDDLGGTLTVTTALRAGSRIHVANCESSQVYPGRPYKQ
jgi:hypothetical protein